MPEATSFDSVDAFIGAARKAEASQQWETALRTWDDCIAAFANDRRLIDWNTARARVLFELGRQDEAQAACEILIRTRPDIPANFVVVAQIALRARDWPALLDRIDTLLAEFPDHPQGDYWRSVRAVTLFELGQLDQANAASIELSQTRPDLRHNFEVLARIAQHNLDWALALTRWDEYLKQFPDDSPSRYRQMSRALCLEKLGDWQAAYGAWDCLAGDLPQDGNVLYRRARSLVQWRGSNADTERFVQSAVNFSPRNQDLRILFGRIAMDQDDFRVALNRFLAAITLDARNIVPFELAIDAAEHLGDICAATDIVAHASADQAESIAFRCRVLLQALRLQGDVSGGLAIIQDLDTGELDRASIFRVIRFLNDVTRYDLLLDFTTQLLDSHSEDPGMAAAHLSALLRVQGRAAFDREKLRLLDTLKPSGALSLLNSLDMMLITSDEVKMVIDDIVASTLPDPVKSRRLIWITHRRDPDVQEYLAERLLKHGGIPERLSARLLLSGEIDRRRLEVANLGELDWNEFVQSTEALWRHVDAALSEGADQKVLSRQMWPCMSQLRTFRNVCGRAWLNSGDCYADAATFAFWLQDRIASRRPTSIIRLGDGEGHFLPYPKDTTSDQIATDRRNIQAIWWGETRLAGEEADTLARELASSIARADAIGIPPVSRLLVSLQRGEIGRNARGVANVTRFIGSLSKATLANKVLTSCHIHSDLHVWDLYRQVFSNLKRISVISCHDLSGPLALRFGLQVADWIKIPAEHVSRGMFGDSGVADEYLYPVVFNRILNELAPARAEVFLVAAGFLGKLFCDRICQRGGIGIDIGSVADLWAGHQTRNVVQSEIDFDVSSSLIVSQPFEDRFDPGHVGDSGLCHSDRTRNVDVMQFPNIPRVDLRESAADRRKLRIVGHPRCGSGYVAAVFVRLGLQLGHERLAADGLCSWINTVDDLNPPYKAPTVPRGTFLHTLSYVRDPVSAIPSIMIENCKGASFNFRRFHIARELGVDIAKYSDPIARAVASYVLWMEIVDSQKPLLTLRIERMPEDIKSSIDVLRNSDINIDSSLCASIANVPADINASQFKTSIPKPIIEQRQYMRLPVQLVHALDRFCDRYDYELPWQQT